MSCFDENGKLIPIEVVELTIPNQTCPICGGAAVVRQLNRYKYAVLDSLVHWHLCKNPVHEYGRLRHKDDGYYQVGDLIKVYRMPFSKGICIDTSTYTLERIIEIHWDENYIIAPEMTTLTLRDCFQGEDYTEKFHRRGRIRRFDYRMEGVVRLSRNHS